MGRQGALYPRAVTAVAPSAELSGVRAAAAQREAALSSRKAELAELLDQARGGRRALVLQSSVASNGAAVP
jgi:hypothetical protein